MKNKSLKLFFYVLLIISVVIGLAFLFFNGDDNKMVSPILNWAYILLFIGIVLAVILPLIFRSGRGGKKTLWELVILVAVLLVSFLLASGNAVSLSPSVPEPTHGTLKMTDTVLITSIILLVGAILATIFGSLLRKKS
ncbi:MAG: hypothetical protein J6Z32_02255 [Bacteroidales bacterium]|nr:hypothetical protein [Bacteroidales bacterium]